LDLTAPVSQGSQPGKLHLCCGLLGGLGRLLDSLGGLGGCLVGCEGGGGETEDETETEGEGDELFHIVYFSLNFRRQIRLVKIIADPT